MRIFFICKRFYTNKDLLNERFGRLYHLPEKLVKYGSEVWVDALDYRTKGSKELTVKDVHFRTIPASFTKVLALPYVLYRHCLSVKPDIIIASGDSHIGFIALLVANKLHIPFVFDVYDYYPLFKGNRIPIMKSMFRYAVKKADLVLCASEALLNRLACLNANRMLVENGVDTSLFSPMEMSQARKVLQLEQESVFVGYFGSINAARGPLLIEACQMLRKDFPSLRLLLAGKVDDVDVKEPWIRYFGDLPQKNIPVLINSCNIVTIPYADTPFNRMCGACKIAEYLACGKPIVATRVSIPDSILNRMKLMFCDSTPTGLADSIRKQLIFNKIEPFPVSLCWENIGKNVQEKLYSMIKK